MLRGPTKVRIKTSSKVSRGGTKYVFFQFLFFNSQFSLIWLHHQHRLDDSDQLPGYELLSNVSPQHQRHNHLHVAKGDQNTPLCRVTAWEVLQKQLTHHVSCSLTWSENSDTAWHTWYHWHCHQLVPPMAARTKILTVSFIVLAMSRKRSHLIMQGRSKYSCATINYTAIF